MLKIIDYYINVQNKKAILQEIWNYIHQIILFQAISDI